MQTKRSSNQHSIQTEQSASKVISNTIIQDLSRRRMKEEKDKDRQKSKQFKSTGG